MKHKVGLIGCGGIAGQKHLPALKNASDRVEIVAFCDLIIERAEKAAREYGVPGALVCTDYHVLLAQPEIEQLPNLQSRQNAVELGLGCCLCLDVDTLCASPSVRTLALDTPVSGISCYWKPDSEKPAVGAFAALLADLKKNQEEGGAT